MHHTRSQGSPSFAAFSEPERELHERTRDFRERLKQLCENQVRPVSPIPFAHMGDANPPARRTVHRRAKDGVTGARSSITRPTIPNTNSWQIPSHVTSTITHATQFHGLEDEDAPRHVSHSARICDTFNITGVSKDAIYLRLFPFSSLGVHLLGSTLSQTTRSPFGMISKPSSINRAVQRVVEPMSPTRSVVQGDSGEVLQWSHLREEANVQ
ncbi:hypothetical protein L1987_07084 [Smallanthus sonchifolius]|uniref:Uncharacterized protein n=1 Tax=Smallanthus sonchifolius TaxID=185202 RepID=A0ACB9K022_9ASTR|nr:hypothetical protein L1987_07084 [Smallanthus sonchifolius]